MRSCERRGDEEVIIHHQHHHYPFPPLGSRSTSPANLNVPDYSKNEFFCPIVSYLAQNDHKILIFIQFGPKVL